MPVAVKSPASETVAVPATCRSRASSTSIVRQGEARVAGVAAVTVDQSSFDAPPRSRGSASARRSVTVSVSGAIAKREVDPRRVDAEPALRALRDRDELQAPAGRADAAGATEVSSESASACAS